MRIEYNIFLESMKRHGVDDPVYSAKIEAALGISGTEVREWVRRARRDGHPIAQGKSGYFWAKTLEELQPTIDDMRGRALSLLETVSALENIYEIQEELFGEAVGS